MSPPRNSVLADGSDAGLAEKMCTLCATFGSTLSKSITTGVFAGAARHFVSNARLAALRLIVVPLGAHDAAAPGGEEVVGPLEGAVAPGVADAFGIGRRKA